MRIIDMASWPRRHSFAFFSSYRAPEFNVCADVTITSTYRYLKAHGIHRFTAIMWQVCNAANRVEELRYRTRAGQVVEHELVHPSFTWLNDDGTLTFCMARYSHDVREFFDNVERSVAGIDTNPLAADSKTEEDILYISCVPWISFTAISHPTKGDDTDTIPRISWGKFREKEGCWTMPVSLQLHHGLADGCQAGQFFCLLQELLDRPEETDWPLSRTRVVSIPKPGFLF